MSERKNKSLVELAVTFGIILALARILIDFALKTADVSGMVYYVGFVIAFIVEIVLIMMAISRFKKSVNNGLLSFTEAVKIGIIMMILCGIGFIISTSLIDPEFQNRKAIEMVEKYNPDELENTRAQIAKAAEDPKYFISFALVLLYFIFLGFVISAIGGAIMRKSEDQL